MSFLVILSSFSVFCGVVSSHFKRSGSEQRLSRIGEILAAGVSRHLANTCMADSPPLPAEARLPLKKTESRLLMDLFKFSSLSPGEIQRRMSCSRSTALRLVTKLRKDGLVETHGKTSGTQVKLTMKGHRIAKALDESAPLP